MDLPPRLGNRTLLQTEQNPECRETDDEAASPTAIAIVDDDPAVRKALTRLLSALGYRTEAFGSAEEFLLAAPTGKRDCILVDINLGDTSGLELVHQFSARGFISPVIFMSGVEDETFQRRARELGCIAFLRKPFPADHLVKAIKAAVDLSPPRAGNVGL
jgi:FixJ family two-component response regulator